MREISFNYIYHQYLGGSMGAERFASFASFEREFAPPAANAATMAVGARDAGGVLSRRRASRGRNPPTPRKRTIGRVATAA